MCVCVRSCERERERERMNSAERDELLDDSWFSGFHTRVDGHVIDELGNKESCVFGNKGEVFGSRLVEFEVPMELSCLKGCWVYEVGIGERI